MSITREKYLDTLGIPQYLYSGNHTVEAIDKSIKCLVVELNPEASFCVSGKSQDFLFKMLSAIGISSDDVELVTTNSDNLSVVISKYKADTILVMNPDIKPINNKCFITHHPSSVLSNPELKRDTWEVLKKLQSCLK